MREDARLLPVIQWDGREFLVDVGARRFRNVDDAGDFIDMHSKKGREMVRQMQETVWHVFAVDTGGQTDLEYEDYDGGSSTRANRHQGVQPGGSEDA